MRTPETVNGCINKLVESSGTIRRVALGQKDRYESRECFYTGPAMRIEREALRDGAKNFYVYLCGKLVYHSAERGRRNNVLKCDYRGKWLARLREISSDPIQSEFKFFRDLKNFEKK